MQESDGGANTQGKQLLGPVSGDAKILLFEILFILFLFSFVEIGLKFSRPTACLEHQAGRSAVKCLSQRRNRMAREAFKVRPLQSQTRRSNH